MSTGFLIVLAIFLIFFTGPVNAAVTMGMLWVIWYLIGTFPNLDDSKK